MSKLIWLKAASPPHTYLCRDPILYYWSAHITPIKSTHSVVSGPPFNARVLGPVLSLPPYPKQCLSRFSRFCTAHSCGDHCVSLEWKWHTRIYQLHVGYADPKPLWYSSILLCTLTTGPRSYKPSSLSERTMQNYGVCTVLVFQWVLDFICLQCFCFQCFDAVGWVAGRASGL